MSAEYPKHDVTLDAPARVVRVSVDVRNASAETWRPADGFAIGYHLFDAETGALIVDGARVRPGSDVRPGGTAHAEFEFAIPEEDGSYAAYISPLLEGARWYYDSGWPFVLAEFRVQAGAPSLRRVRVATRGDVTRARALRSIGRAFTFPALTIWRNRKLIASMARRDILGRYRGSFGGAFWAVLSPLLLMLTYFFVFGLVLRARLPEDSSPASFALYFLAGMLPWLAFSEAVSRAPGVVLEHRNFVKKLVFSVETLPVNLVASGLVSELVALLLFAVFLFLLRGAVPLSAAWIPLLIVPQILLTAGLCWFLAALGVFARDLGQIIGFLLTIWFFLTPICYPEASWSGLPHFVTLVLSRNPMYVLVRGYRAVLLGHPAIGWGSIWKLWLLSGTVFVLGHAWFYKLRKSFADII